MEQLNIGTCHGKDFRLALALVTSTQAILARKRSGKSYTASVQAEEMLAHRQQVVVIDPTSAWWGLRSSADGKSAGFDIIVFGGDHADAPLDFRAGKAMAAALVEHGFSAIFDIGNLHTEEQAQFVMDLCSELLRLNRNAMHVFMDEADTFAPQKPLGLLQNKCLGTVSRLVKQGGIKGIGFTMITQRPASINKDVLSQVDILTVLRMSHPLDIKAATDWIKSEVSVPFAKEVEVALPSLPVGTAYFCSASLNLGKRVEVRTRTTFNSGATPKPGERAIVPKVLAPVEIEKLGQKIADSVKRSREESPEFLKAKIKTLEAEVAKGGKPSMELSAHIAELEQQVRELPHLREKAAQADVIQAHMITVRQHATDVQTALGLLLKACDVPMAPIPTGMPLPPAKPILAQAATFHPSSTPVARQAIPPIPSASGKQDLSFRILRALAEFASIGRHHVPRSTLSAWAEARGGYYTNTLGQLKTAGLIEYPGVGTVGLTAEGRSRAAIVEAPPNADAFFEAVVRQGGTGLPERVLRVLRHNYPSPITREQLSVAAEARGGYFTNTLGSLKTAGFIEYPGTGQVRLQPWTVME
jgi:uncharacterized protein